MKKRGFVTIATGAERYFMMARTLLYSYRLTSREPLPFAIITDKVNKFTKEFDDVIILENCTCTYIDKLMLLTKAPYEENIFLDADCVAYQDLNKYWSVFKNADDFSCLGEILPLTDTQRGWFKLSGAGKYASQVKYIPNFHGGIYYIRPGKTCDKMYQICSEIVQHFEQYKFRSQQPADEPIIALAMSVCNCYPKHWLPEHFICYWNASVLHVDFDKRKLIYSTKWFKTQRNGMLLHWGNAFTSKVVYRFEEEKIIMQYMGRYNNWKYILLYKLKLKKYMLFVQKILRKLDFKSSFKSISEK